MSKSGGWLCVIALVLVGCGSKTLAPTATGAGTGSGAVPTDGGTGAGSATGSAVAPIDAPAAGWHLGCATDDDCILVSPAVVACPGACGFCPGLVAVLKGTPAIKCPPVPDYSKADPPQPAPNCAPCQQAPEVRATCRANACIATPV